MLTELPATGNVSPSTSPQPSSNSKEISKLGPMKYVSKAFCLSPAIKAAYTVASYQLSLVSHVSNSFDFIRKASYSTDSSSGSTSDVPPKHSSTDAATTPSGVPNPVSNPSPSPNSSPTSSAPSSVTSSPISRIIIDDFQFIKKNYTATRFPILLCHGLFGFDTIKSPVPVIVKDLSYWHGIKEALEAAGSEVFSASVPPIGPIETRAKYLAEILDKWAKDKHTTDDEPIRINLIAHSMGGLDARYMASILKPPHIKVLSLTTIGTPHQGTSFADHIFDEIPLRHIGKLLKVLALVGGIEDPAGIKQLTTKYMQNEFNPKVLDDPEVYYSSYGARVEPRWTSILRYSGTYIKAKDGDNDGLVSVESSKWGEYLGTIEDCDHLDLVNLVGINHWLKWIRQETHSFNAIALYLHIMDSLAKRGY